MGEWKEYKLEAVTEPTKDTYNPDGTDQYTYIGLEHIDQGTLRLNSIGVSSDITSNKFIFKANDILFGKLRPYFRKVVKPKFDGICSTDIWVFRAKKGFDQNYLFYFLANWDFVDTANNGEGGTRMPRADWNFLRKTEWNFPELIEQQSIASILSSLDDKIDLLHRQNKTLEALAETLFRQWFVEEADESWEEKALNELLEFVVDNRGKSVPTTGYGIPLIATNCIKNSSIFPVFEKVRYLSEETYQKWFRSHPLPGDIIFVNKGTPGCVNLVPRPVDFCIAQDMIALRANKKKMSNYFLFLYLRSEKIQSDIVNSSVGTTIPHLKKTDLLKFPIINPGREILIKFDRIVEPLFEKMLINYLQIRTLTLLRDTLLPKLMSGEVRVKN